MNDNLQLSASQILESFDTLSMATAVYTSDDIIINYANDAMIAFWGRDKSVIGKSLDEALPEIKNQPFMSMLRAVWRTGITDAGKAIRAELLVDGLLQTFYYDYEYKAVRNAQGEIYAILHTAKDVTDIVTQQQEVDILKGKEAQFIREQELNEELSAANEELSAINEELNEAQEALYNLNTQLEARVLERTEALSKSESRARFLLSDAPVSIAVFSGNDHIIESANKMVLEVWGKSPEIIGKPIQLALPELVGQMFIDVLDGVYRTGEPFIGNEVPALLEQNGVINEVYSNFVYQPLKDDHGVTTGIMLVAVVVTEAVKARKLMEENEKRFQFLLNAMPQQVWTSRPDGILDYVNQVVSNDFGKPGEQIVGEGWQAFIHPDDLKDCLNAWKQALENGKEYLCEFRLLFKNGNYVWHLARALPLIDDGQIRMWLGTNTDIDLQKTNEQRKDEFISIASHELKTPLTSIKAFNQLMGKVDDPERLSKFVSKSADSILRLEKLITDLLDVTKINAGKMSYNLAPFDFNQMIHESIESVQYTTNTHQITLQSEIDINYVGDRFRLEQVMNNFLSNAIKYSPDADRVLVNVSEKEGDLIVSVKDFGIGIPSDKIDRIFDRYYRIDNTDMRFEGLGLGLFISSEILKRHHGSFFIESEEGAGATFSFRLPLRPQEL